MRAAAIPGSPSTIITRRRGYQNHQRSRGSRSTLARSRPSADLKFIRASRQREYTGLSPRWTAKLGRTFVALATAKADRTSLRSRRLRPDSCAGLTRIQNRRGTGDCRNQSLRSRRRRVGAGGGRIAVLGHAPIKLPPGESVTVDFGYVRSPLGALIEWGEASINRAL